MNTDNRDSETVFKHLGKVHLNEVTGAFIVETEGGAILHLCPNSDDGIGAGIHVDEITVREGFRRKGAARKAMAGLCRLADEHKFVLKGGPIGWSDDPWSERFVAWLGRLGFLRDPSPPAQVDDRTAFYARRLPRPSKKPARRL